MNIGSYILLNAGLVGFVAAVIFCFLGVKKRSTLWLMYARVAAMVGIGFHIALFVHRGLSLGFFPATNLFEFTLLLGNALMMGALLIDLTRRIPIVLVGSAPLALVCLVFAAALAGGTSNSSAKVTSFWTAMHVLTTVAAFGSFALAFVCGLLYLMEQQQLKGRPGPAMLGILPSLESLYRLTVLCAGVGVGLLTAGVLVGYLYARSTETVSDAWRTDPKVLLTTATWIGYGLVVLGSFLPYFRGRRTAWASVVCFILLVLTVWATAFWSPFHPYR